MGPGNGDEKPRGFLEEAFEHWQQTAEASADEAEEPDAGLEPDEPLEAQPEPGAPEVGVIDAETVAPPVQSAPPPVQLTDDDRALVDEAMKKSGLIWIEAGSGRAAQAVWYHWADGAAYVLTGGAEQPDAGLSESSSARVIARSKDTRSRLIEWPGSVTRLSPADPDWEEIAGALAKARLNLSEPAAAPARWAQDPAMAVYRIAPAGPLIEGPGQYSDTGNRAQPVPTAAVTAGPPPKVIHRRQTSRRPLS